jgi:hypothetical protein
MNDKDKLFYVKLIHTIIWIIFVSVIFYIVYSAVFNKITIYTWMAIFLILFEGAVLLVFRGKCPLTVIARKYSNSTKHNFDIFLPEWLAKHNQLIFTILYLIGVIMVLYRAGTYW